MNNASDILELLQVLLLFGLLGVSSLFLILTVINRQRLDGAVYSFPTGKLWGLPVLPVLFVAVLIILYSIARAKGLPSNEVVFLGYMLGALLWGAASFVASLVVITDMGIVRNMNSRDGTLAWGQIEDYFSSASRRAIKYTFFYRDEAGRRQRFEVSVPKEYAKDFSIFVENALEARFKVRRRRRSHRELGL